MLHRAMKCIGCKSGYCRARISSRRMKSGSRFGVAVLLAALLLLNGSGLCAAMAVDTKEPAHPCCPSPASQSAIDCCMISGIPVTPMVSFVPGAPDGVILPTSAGLWAGVGQWRQEAAAAAAVSPPGPLFLRIHQFLI